MVRADSERDWRPAGTIAALSQILPAWYWHDDELIYGPFSPLDIKRLSQQGKIVATTSLRCGAGGAWIKACQLGWLAERADDSTCSAAAGPTCSAAAGPTCSAAGPSAEGRCGQRRHATQELAAVHPDVRLGAFGGSLGGAGGEPFLAAVLGRTGAFYLNCCAGRGRGKGQGSGRRKGQGGQRGSRREGQGTGGRQGEGRSVGGGCQAQAAAAAKAKTDKEAAAEDAAAKTKEAAAAKEQAAAQAKADEEAREARKLAAAEERANRPQRMREAREKRAKQGRAEAITGGKKADWREDYRTNVLGPFVQGGHADNEEEAKEAVCAMQHLTWGYAALSKLADLEQRAAGAW